MQLKSCFRTIVCIEMRKNKFSFFYRIEVMLSASHQIAWFCSFVIQECLYVWAREKESFIVSHTPSSKQTKNQTPRTIVVCESKHLLLYNHSLPLSMNNKGHSWWLWLSIRGSERTDHLNNNAWGCQDKQKRTKGEIYILSFLLCLIGELWITISLTI